MKKIGVVGIGNMGSGIAQTLLKGGYEVAVYSRRCGRAGFDWEQDETVRPLVKAGAVVMPGLHEIAAFSDLVITSLPMPEDVEAVCTGADGLLEHMAPGSYLVDTSTIDVETTRRIHEKAAEKGIRTLDAPVSGGPQGAKNGTMTMMVGGEKPDFDACMPVFQCIGGNINYMGPIGTGQMVKLCNQALSATQSAVLGEVFVVGRKAGLDLDAMVNVIRTSSGDCWMLDNFFPETVLAKTYEPPKFALRMMLKDIDLYMRTAKSLQAPSTISGVVCQMFSAAMAMGNAERDVTSVVQVSEELGRQKIVP